MTYMQLKNSKIQKREENFGHIYSIIYHIRKRKKYHICISYTGKKKYIICTYIK